VKIVKYLEFLAKVYSSIAGNVVPNCLRQNYVTSLLCAVKISNITCLRIPVA